MFRSCHGNFVTVWALVLCHLLFLCQNGPPSVQIFIHPCLPILLRSQPGPPHVSTDVLYLMQRWPRLQTAPYSTVSQERNNKDPDLSATGSKEGGNSTLYLQRTVRSAQRRHSAENINQQWYHESQIQGLYSLRRHRLISIGIPIINLRRSSDRLRFIMGIPIPVRRRLLSE